MNRHKDANWVVPEKPQTDQAALMVLQDIRDELKAINLKLGCYRMPRALDDLHSLGIAARRRRRRKSKK